MFQCPNCRAEYDSPQPQCSLCGAVMAVAAPGVPTTVTTTADQRQRKLLIGIVVLLVLALVAVGGIWFAMFSGGDRKPPQALVTPTASPTPRDTVILSSIADKGVREALATLDKDKDGSLTLGERKDVKELTVSGASKVDKLGTMLPALTTLTVSGGTSQSVDVSDAPGLTSLNVESEPIESLDLSHNTALTDLHVNPNTVLTGMDKVQGLRETWLLTSINASGIHEATGEKVTRSVKVELDSNGRPTRVSDQGFNPESDDGANTDVDVEVDDAGRVVRSAEHGTNFATGTQYSYDDQGRLTAAKSFGPVQEAGLSYTYDAQGRLDQVVDALSLCNPLKLDYDDQGRLNSVVLWDVYGQGCGTRTDFQYDSAGRVSSRGDISYRYDDQGRIVGSRIAQLPFAGNVTAGDVVVTYDSVGRVKSTQLNNVSPVEFTYDKFGNLVSAKNEYESAKMEYVRLITPSSVTPMQLIRVVPWSAWIDYDAVYVGECVGIIPDAYSMPTNILPDWPVFDAERFMDSWS